MGEVCKAGGAGVGCQDLPPSGSEAARVPSAVQFRRSDFDRGGGLGRTAAVTEEGFGRKAARQDRRGQRKGAVRVFSVSVVVVPVCSDAFFFYPLSSHSYHSEHQR